jgi:class II lanthipeptide synthase
VSVYREQVADAIRAVAIRDALRYEWLGRPSRRLAPAEVEALEHASPLAGWLRDELYSSFYCYGRVVPARRGEPLPETADPALERELIAASSGQVRRQRGWSLVRTEGDTAVVMLDGVHACVPVDACGAEADGTVSVPLPPVIAPSPGFLTVIGERDLEARGAYVRVYWHVTSSGAPALTRTLTGLLNARAVPFRLKAADHPLRYERCDAAVLYLRPDDFESLRPRLVSLGRELASRLRPEVPAFTLPLVPGVGLAEDRSADVSFGERRCMLLAQGILTAHAERAPALGAVLDRFDAADIDIDAPYREPSLSGRHVL